MTKLCTNCKHRRKWLFTEPQDAFCLSGSTSVNLVTGEKAYESCRHARVLGLCGQSGKNYNPKETFLEKFMYRLNWWIGR